jgi:hypothetical protein
MRRDAMEQRLVLAPRAWHVRAVGGVAPGPGGCTLLSSGVDSHMRLGVEWIERLASGAR